ncbi:2-amino-4-hydroxy-6-hydroxymethyldihydropteridine diphosphokinase [Marinimicrobium sp. ABcell2]|uniref:2-amino-4-hydroxy-6- hydroxymethyldihydropteridine diphosphokinase n=1 Tax=Marinimicrobium sp. ABcell2 TaxID=3069751 RepID=UPI0027AFFC4A|nr:2-amino-4-hydroxy-6-hydroxymethyldihydropteridine diphosphokinase [Marinimicrobium sp. ABcell2]MDQ2077670.1 2-amino-4-hydroxy-6-hydroxymethyldihydropteridine diphosphokinase [Marinimicrobium sp. ABcell2]
MVQSEQRAYIGLGSNLDDPRHQVETALQELGQLPNTRLIAASALYQSRPIGPPQPDFVNAVAALDTTLPPLALLDQLQTLEQRHQRVRREHWGPRTLDLDLLLYGDSIIDQPRLQVPHPELSKRNFVLYPLAELAPDLTLPSGTPLAALLTHVSQDGLQHLAP